MCASETSIKQTIVAESSPVAAPLVPIDKSDDSGDISLCGKVVTHPILKVVRYFSSRYE